MDINLPPREWKSDRPKPHEPIFGDGAPGALAYLVGWFATVGLLYFLR